MVESVMYFGIGFLCASLLGLVIIPLVHNRAARLTTRRLEAATPLSIAEIQADRDQLRAEFAVSTRRLEISVEQLKARSTAQLSELGKKTEMIAMLRHELGEKSAALTTLEAHVKALQDQTAASERELSSRSSTAHDTGLALADKEAALARLTAEFDVHAAATGAHKVEILNLNTQVDALKAQLERNEQGMKEAQERLARERRRIQDLETRLTEQSRALVEREHVANQLRADLDAAKKNEADLLAKLAAVGDSRRESAGDGRADNDKLHAELVRLSEERTKLAQEIAAMKNEAEQAWTNERAEDALLRECINDIAAEVARLTMALEGANSPIETILAADAPPAAGANGGESRGRNLADRIRALQNRASRLQPAS